MIQLFARNKVRVDLNSTSNKGQLFNTVYEYEAGDIEYGYDWNDNNSIIFEGTGISANNTLLVQGTTYTIRFKVNYHANTPDNKIKVVIYDNETDLNPVDTSVYSPASGTYEYTFNNIAGNTFGFVGVDTRGSVYDIDISKGSSISYEYTELDIKSDENVVFSKSLKDVRTPDKLSGEYTKPFLLPITPINSTFFGAIEHNDTVSNFEVGKTLKAVISVDGLNQVDGRLELISIITNEDGAKYFNVIFYSNKITLFQILSENKLNDLDTTDLPIEYTASNIKSTVNTAGVIDGVTAAAEGQEYQFGYIERGEHHNSIEHRNALTENAMGYIPNIYQNGLDPVTGIIEDSFIPGIFNPYLFKRIHELQGYTVEGNILEENAFKDLIVPLNKAIPSDSGLKIEDHCFKMEAEQTHSRSVGWNHPIFLGNNQGLFIIGQSDEGLNLYNASGSYSRFIPPNPVRANTNVILDIESILTSNPNNKLMGIPPVSGPDDRELSKFGINFRFALHPMHKWGPGGNRMTDISMPGFTSLLTTQPEPGETDTHSEGTNKYIYKINVGNLLYYAKEYYGEDYSKYSYFKLYIYYDTFIDENGGDIEALELALAEKLYDQAEAFDIYFAEMLVAANFTLPDTDPNYVPYDEIVATITGYRDTHGKTAACALEIYNYEYWVVSATGISLVVSAYDDYTDLYDSAESDYNDFAAEWHADYDMGINDKMDCEFTITSTIETVPETTDVLLPFGQTIENPATHIGGDISQMDYVKNIINMFNLMVRIDESTKVITYDKWDEFFAEEINDYTDKIILDNKIEKKFVNNLVPRYMDFQLENISFDTNTIDYLTEYDANPSLYQHDSRNEYESNKITNYIKSKFVFNEDISLNYEHTSALNKIAAVHNDELTEKRVDNWGFSMMFWNKKINTYTSSEAVIKLSSWDLTDTIGENFFYDYPLFTNDIEVESCTTLMNTFGMPKKIYTSINPITKYSTWITGYWNKFLTSINSQESFLLTASFYLSAEDYYNIHMNNRIRIGNEIYYINVIKDWNASKPTELELIKFANNTNDIIEYVDDNDIYNYEITNSPTAQLGSIAVSESNLATESSNVIVLSGLNNTIFRSTNVIILGSSNEVTRSTEIVISKNATNVTVINSSNLNIDESNVTYINNLKITDGENQDEIIINSGGLDSVQEDFTDAGIVDGGLDVVYAIDWQQSYKVEDGGENRV